MPTSVASGDLATSAPEPSASAARAEGGRPSPKGSKEVLLRIASAVVLAPTGLWVAYVGGAPLLIATIVCSVIAGAEWTRMAAGPIGLSGKIAFHLLFAASAVAAVLAAPFGLDKTALIASLAATIALLIAVGAGGARLSMAFGAIYTTLPFGAFVWLRSLNDPPGRLVLLSLLVIVWATDIAAYFAGRGFGGPLLSPKDSPNKTWTGAIGALLCAGLAGAAVARAIGGDFGAWLFTSVVVSIVAQAGDLLESRFKRIFGVKDTSGVVPGHGGVLDRLDALMAATVFAAVVLQIFPGLAPGYALHGASR